MVVVRSQGRILELKTFMADVPDIAVTAVAVIFLERKLDVVFCTVFQLIFTGFDIPDSPRSDDLHIRSEGFDTELETNLVVSFTGSTVTDRNSAFFFCNINEDLCDQRAGHCSTEKVFVLVCRICLYARSDIIVAEFINNVFDI